MYDHIGLKVGNLSRSVKFYSAALGALGYELCSQDETSAGLGPKGEPALWLYAGAKSPGNGTHVAFRARDRGTVDRFHKAGLANGASDHGQPGLRNDYSPTYYAAFLLDPDGNNIEAVCMT